MYAKPIPIQETFVVLEPRKYNPKFPRKFHECPIPGSFPAPTRETPTLTRSLSQSNNNVAFSRAQAGGTQASSESTPKPLGAGQARQARRDNTSPPVPLVRALSNDQNNSASEKEKAIAEKEKLNVNKNASSGAKPVDNSKVGGPQAHVNLFPHRDPAHKRQQRENSDGGELSKSGASGPAGRVTQSNCITKKWSEVTNSARLYQGSPGATEKDFQKHSLLIVSTESISQRVLYLPDTLKDKCKISTLDISAASSSTEVTTALSPAYLAAFKLRDMLCKYRNSKSSVVFLVPSHDLHGVSYLLDCLLHENTVVYQPAVVVAAHEDVQAAVTTACHAAHCALGTLVISRQCPESANLFSALHFHSTPRDRAIGRISHRNVSFHYTKINPLEKIQIPLDISYLLFSSINILVWMCDQELPEELMQDVDGVVIVWSDNAGFGSFCNNSPSSSGGLPVNPNLIATLKKLEFESLQKVVSSPNGLVIDNFFQDEESPLLEFVVDSYELLDPLQAKIQMAFQIAVEKSKKSD